MYAGTKRSSSDRKRLSTDGEETATPKKKKAKGKRRTTTETDGEMAQHTTEADAGLVLLDLPIDALSAIAGHLDLRSLVAFSTTCSLLHRTFLQDDYHGEGTRAWCGSKPACSRFWGRIFYRRYNRELPLGSIYSAAMGQLEEKARGDDDSDRSSEMASDAFYEGLDVDWAALEGLEGFRNEGERGFVAAFSHHLKEAAEAPPFGYCALNSVCALWYESTSQIIPGFWQLWSCGLITSSGQTATHTHFHPPDVDRYRRLSRTEKELEEELERKQYKVYRVPCWKRLVVASHLAERIRDSLFSFKATSEITIAPEAICAPVVLRARIPNANSSAAAAAGVAEEDITVITGEGSNAAVTEVVLRHTMRLGPAAVVSITPMAQLEKWKASERINREALVAVLSSCGVTGFCEITISTCLPSPRVFCCL